MEDSAVTFIEHSASGGGHTAVTIVAIVFGSILTALAIAASLISKMLGVRGGSRLSDEESQLMQELFYGMKKMGERVESLETILLERDRTRTER